LSIKTHGSQELFGLGEIRFIKSLSFFKKRTKRIIFSAANKLEKKSKKYTKFKANFRLTEGDNRVQIIPIYKAEICPILFAKYRLI
jgi:hypothetical protein